VRDEAAVTAFHAMAAALASMLVLLGPFDDRLGAQFPKGLLAGTSFGCTIETRPVAFGNYDALSYFPLSAQGQVIYSCGTSIIGPLRTVRIELSKGGAGTYQRRMSAGVELLSYNLYLDASHHSIWGDGSGGTDYYFSSYPPNNTPVIVPIYAHLPARQDVKVGLYADALYARILF
jgi:spore coat protein U-like protein